MTKNRRQKVEVLSFVVVAPESNSELKNLPGGVCFFRLALSENAVTALIVTAKPENGR